MRVQAPWDAVTATTATTLPSLARRIRELTAEAAAHRQAILVLVRAGRPDLLTPAGPADRGRHRAVRPVHPGRCRTDAAFAMLAGDAPIGLQRPDRPVRLPRSGIASPTRPCPPWS